MSAVEDKGPGQGLVQRVRDILTRPSATWETIDGEAPTVGGLYRGYVLPLAAIPAVCGFIGTAVFGVGLFGFHYRPAILSTAVQALVGYLVTLAGVYVLALIIDALAPSFGGEKNRIQAFKVAAYSGTAAWLAGVFQLIPMLSFLGLVGLYSLYLLWTGLPRLMKSPKEKTLLYVVVVVILVAVFWLIVMAVVTPLVRLSGGGGPFGGGVFGARHAGETLRLPGGGTVDLGKAEEAARRMERAARTGKAELVATDALKATLPAGAAGFTRGEVSTETATAGGFGAATAQADYVKGDGQATVKVIDTSGAGPMAGMLAALSIERSREDGASYEKVGRVDGRMTMEKYDSDDRSGEYTVIVAERFMVQAEGRGVTMADLKTLVGAVDEGALKKLAR